MNIREALMIGSPSLVLHRAAQDEIARLDALVVALQERLELTHARLVEAQKDALKYQTIRSQHESSSACSLLVFAPDSDRENECTLYEVSSEPGALDKVVEAIIEKAKP